jgi:hypothetical protein
VPSCPPGLGRTRQRPSRVGNFVLGMGTGFHEDPGNRGPFQSSAGGIREFATRRLEEAPVGHPSLKVS